MLATDPLFSAAVHDVDNLIAMRMIMKRMTVHRIHVGPHEEQPVRLRESGAAKPLVVGPWIGFAEGIRDLHKAPVLRVHGRILRSGPQRSTAQRPNLDKGRWRAQRFRVLDAKLDNLRRTLAGCGSVLTAFLTVMISPIAFILLVMTGVGIFLVPFLGAALLFTSLFGTAVVLAWFGVALLVRAIRLSRKKRGRPR